MAEQSAAGMMRPIEECYWVVPGKLLAGEYPRNFSDAESPAKTGALLRAGVKAFIDLTTDADGLRPYDGLIGKAAHLRFPIPDVRVPHSASYTRSILDAIDERIDRGELVYVHCWGGVGRTGVIVGCWLSEHGYPGILALQRLRQLWKECPKSRTHRSPESPEQEQYIIDWRMPNSNPSRV